MNIVNFVVHFSLSPLWYGCFFTTKLTKYITKNTKLEAGAGKRIINN